MHSLSSSVRFVHRRHGVRCSFFVGRGFDNNRHDSRDVCDNDYYTRRSETVERVRYSPRISIEILVCAPRPTEDAEHLSRYITRRRAYTFTCARVLYIRIYTSAVRSACSSSACEYHATTIARIVRFFKCPTNSTAAIVDRQSRPVAHDADAVLLFYTRKTTTTTVVTGSSDLTLSRERTRRQYTQRTQ